MRLSKLELNHFKGISHFEITPNLNSLNVYGKNEAGKTTLADAITWLLFDKDSLGRSPEAFGIKTRENGKVKHHLDHEVIGQFNIRAGYDMALRKVYKENWVKRRGSADSELSGHTTDYYVDDVPVKKSEYQEAVHSIMDEELFRILTIPTYFPEQLHWTDRRRILTDLAGEVSTADIIAGNKDLTGYPAILDGKTHEQREKMLRVRKKQLNDEIDAIPDRIDENARMRVPVENLESHQKEARQLQAKKKQLEDKLADHRNGGGISELRVKIQEIVAKEREAENQWKAQQESELAALREKVANLQNEVDKSSDFYRSEKRAFEESEQRLSTIMGAVEESERKIESIQTREPEPENDKPEVCPYCKQKIKSEHSYDDYLREFNAKKAGDLKSAKIELSTRQEHLRDAQIDYDKRKQSAVKAKGALNQREEALSKARAELAEKKESQPAFTESSDYIELEADRNALLAKIDQIKEVQEDAERKINLEIAEVNEELNEHQKVINLHESNGHITKRITELEVQLKGYADELETVEANLHIMEEFVRARSAMITDRVNDKFRIVNWRLFKPQINGGIEEVAEPMVNGIPYSEGLNSAARVQAGLDIIQTLSEHYGKEAPVIIDGRESVTHLPDTGLQVISLIVSPDDETLRVERVKEGEFQTVGA